MVVMRIVPQRTFCRRRMPAARRHFSSRGKDVEWLAPACWQRTKPAQQLICFDNCCLATFAGGQLAIADRLKDSGLREAGTLGGLIRRKRKTRQSTSDIHR